MGEVAYSVFQTVLLYMKTEENRIFGFRSFVSSLFPKATFYLFTARGFRSKWSSFKIAMSGRLHFFLFFFSKRRVTFILQWIAVIVGGTRFIYNPLMEQRTKIFIGNKKKKKRKKRKALPLCAFGGFIRGILQYTHQ